MAIYPRSRIPSGFYRGCLDGSRLRPIPRIALIARGRARRRGRKVRNAGPPATRRDRCVGILSGVDRESARRCDLWRASFVQPSPPWRSDGWNSCTHPAALTPGRVVPSRNSGREPVLRPGFRGCRRSPLQMFAPPSCILSPLPIAVAPCVQQKELAPPEGPPNFFV